MQGWKEANFDIPGAGKVRTAVVSGLGNTRKLLEALQSGSVQYDFVEIMACPGGCAGGGGQPIHDGEECAEARGHVLWGLDKTSALRFSHENPDVQALYTEFLENLCPSARTICCIPTLTPGRCRRTSDDCCLYQRMFPIKDTKPRDKKALSRGF